MEISWEVVGVPAWSGEFYELEDEDRGLMAVHVSDMKTHLPPPGWKLVRVEEYEDSDVFVYERVQAEGDVA